MVSEERVIDVLRQRMERAERGLRIAWFAIGVLGLTIVGLTAMDPVQTESGAESTPGTLPSPLVEIGEGQFSVDGILWAHGFVLCNQDGERGAALSYGDGLGGDFGPGLRVYDSLDPERKRAALWCESTTGKPEGRVRLQMLDVAGDPTIEMLGMGGSPIGHIWKRSALSAQLESVD